MPHLKTTFQTAPIPTFRVKLTPEFKRAVRLLENGRGHVYITGKAGTGKSTLLRYFRETTDKNIAVVTPTGIAAIAIGGQTIHSFLRLPPRLLERQDVHTAGKNRVIIENLDALIIDEVSMVRADLMDAIDFSLRLNRGRLGEPFGGVRMIFIGDLYQLPPVVREDVKPVFEKRYKSPFFFSADVFKSIDLKHQELTHIFRQTDAEFIRLLNRIRGNACTSKDLEIINRRVADSDELAGGSDVILTTTNKGATYINHHKLNELEGSQFTYDATIKGSFEESSFPTDVSLTLARGAQVMLLRNDPEKRWVNGSIGHVEDLSEEDVIVSIDKNTYAIPKERWEKIEYLWNDEEETIDRKVAGSFEQYPLKLAWAITIHKSQGQTLTRVIIDMEYGAFTHGQLYVALSRCTTLSGIKLKVPIKKTDVIFDERVVEFEGKLIKKH